MATLKVETVHSNFIWLTDIETVETLVHCYPKDGQTAWESLQIAIENLPSENLRERIRDMMVSHCNFDSAVNDNTLGISHGIFVKVTFKSDDRAQLWLLQHGYNYLMDNGKTIDRI